MRKGVRKGCPETHVSGAEGTEQRPVREEAGGGGTVLGGNQHHGRRWGGGELCHEGRQNHQQSIWKNKVK